MLSLAVEAPDNLFADPRFFRGITRIDHAFRQRREFFAGQLSFRVQLIGETNDTDLFFGIEPFDLLNDLTRSHKGKYGDTPQSSSLGWKVTRTITAVLHLRRLELRSHLRSRYTNPEFGSEGRN